MHAISYTSNFKRLAGAKKHLAILPHFITKTLRTHWIAFQHIQELLAAATSKVS